MTTVPIDGAGRLEERAGWQDLILRGIRDALIATDLSGAITYWNDGAAALFGYSADEILGRSLAVLSPEQCPDALPLDLAAIAAGHDNRRDWSGRRRDGMALRVELTASPLQDADGAALGFLAVARDVTDSAREAEHRNLLLAATEALLAARDPGEAPRRIADLAVPALADWCTVGTLEADGAVAWLGMAHRDAALAAQLEAHGQWAGLRLPATAQGLFRIALQTRQTQLAPRVSDEQLRVIARGDTAYLAYLRGLGPISLVAVPLEVRGRLLGVIEYMRLGAERAYTPADLPYLEDLARRAALALNTAQWSDQSQRAQAVSEGRARELEATLEAMADGMIVYDRDVQIVRVNAAARALFALDRSEVYTSLPHAERARLVLVSDIHGRPLDLEAFVPERALRGEVLTGERAVTLRIVNLEGREAEIEVSGTPLRDAAGEIVGAVVVHRDVTARRRTEEALRQQAALLGLAHDAIIVRDPAGHVISWNEGAAALYGWTAVEAVGRITHELLRTRVIDTGCAGAETDAAVVERGGWEGELEHTRRDGTRVVVDSRQSLLRRPDGTPEAILEVNRDAGARRALARLLRLAVALSPTMTAAQVAEAIVAHGLEALGANGAVVAELSEDGASFTILRSAGYPPELEAEWARFPAVPATPLGEAARTREVVLVPTPEAYAARYPGRTPEPAADGSAAWAAIPLLLDERVLGGLGLSFANERSFGEGDRALLRAVGALCAQALERARLYEAERESAARARARSAELETLLDVLPVGIAIARDPAAADIRVNPALAEMLGIPPEANASLNAPPEQRPSTYRVYQQGHELAARELPLDVAAAQGSVIRDMEMEVVRDDGSRLTLLSHAAPLYDDEGRLRGSVGAFLDISERRAFERAREAFLSAAAHDLKTPLTGIRGHAQLARRRLARLGSRGLEPIVEHLAQIDGAIARMVGLIDELMDVVWDQTGQRLALDLRPADLVALVRGVVAQQSASAAHRLRVETELPLLEAQVDAARLERVVGNLLSNAIKYSPEGGDIVVSLTREDGLHGSAAVIAVQDHGLGIPEADLPHIFARFRRARNVIGQIPGTGIGLAGALRIVSEHGGTIGVQSQEGYGSTFTVRLPLDGPQDGEMPTQQGGPEA